MPTTRPRIVLTETDDLGRILDVARRRWPDETDSPAKLLLHLARAGRDAIEEDERQAAEERRHLIRGNAGAGTGLYDPDELDRLREDWPA